MNRGTSNILLIVSGPSGSGKTTLCQRLISDSDGKVWYSISCTTRKPRLGEKDGKDYYFLTKEEFKLRLEAGEFLEWAEVHGNFYGTLKSEVESKLLMGKDVVMDIDVQGAASIRKCDDTVIRRAYVDVFIGVTPGELESRLRGRCTDCEEVIQLRLKNAREENRYKSLYMYSFDSGNRDEDYSRFLNIIDIERDKRKLTI